jgi:hypothetical protein
MNVDVIRQIVLVKGAHFSDSVKLAQQRQIEMSLE